MGKDFDLEISGYSFFDRINIVILLIDPQTGTIRYANPSACNFYGYAIEQLVSMNVGQLNPKPLTETINNLKTAYSGKKDYFTSTHRTASGEDRYVGVYSGPFDTENEHLIMALIHDISNKREADDRLRSLSQAVEQSPATIVITDRNGKIEYANPEFTITTGYTIAEAVGQDPAILKTGEGNRKEIRTL